MLVAAINRCLAPTSKLQMPAWLRSTPLLRWLGLSAAQFSAPRFWDNMELLGKKQIAAISEALAQRLLATCQLDVNSLVFDCTNFDTFIDTENHSRLPQRGHAKSKRTDLRIVGLALLVSVDFHVPLLWKVYPGNQHDSITFAQALQELTKRYQVLARHCRSITLIFDWFEARIFELLKSLDRQSQQVGEVGRYQRTNEMEMASVQNLLIGGGVVALSRECVCGYERSPLPELGAHVPLDRFQDSGPCLLLCVGINFGKSAPAPGGAERFIPKPAGAIQGSQRNPRSDQCVPARGQARLARAAPREDDPHGNG